MYAQFHGVAYGGQVFLRLEHELDVFVVDNALVALRYDERLVYRLAAIHLDGASILAVTQDAAVDGQYGSVGVRPLLNSERVGTYIFGLALVREFQRELCLRARWHVGNLRRALHLQLRNLHAHGGLIKLRSLFVEHGLRLALVGVGSLSAAGDEDWSPS